MLDFQRDSEHLFEGLVTIFQKTKLTVCFVWQDAHCAIICFSLKVEWDGAIDLQHRFGSCLSHTWGFVSSPSRFCHVDLKDVKIFNFVFVIRYYSCICFCAIRYYSVISKNLLPNRKAAKYHWMLREVLIAADRSQQKNVSEGRWGKESSGSERT